MLQANAIGHLIRQHVAATMQNDQRPVYAHIASYNPKTGTCTVLVPSMADPYSGQYVVSPEMPYSTPAAGSSGGIQYHPITGATQEQPTAGEQVMLGFFGSTGGVSAVTASFFNNNKQPIANSLPTNDPIKPGEMIIGQHAGNYIRVRADGGIDLPASALRVGNIAGTLVSLMTEVALAVYNQHTHPNNGASPPTQQMTVGTHSTKILKAN